MVQNKLHWDANNAAGLSKQRNSYQSSPASLCFVSPTASFASQCNLFRTMWPDPAKGLLLYLTTVFLSTMFPQGRSFLFIAEWLWVFFPSGIRAPWRFSDVDVVTSDTFNFVCHTFSIARSFFLRPTYLAVFSLTLPRFEWIRLLEQSLNCNTSLLNYFNLETLPLYLRLILLL